MITSMFEIRHKSGVLLNLNTVLIQATYSSLLEGKPSLSVNEIILQTHRYTMAKGWAKFKSLVLNFPKLSVNDILPDYHLVGHFSILPSSPVSDFLAVWFQTDVSPIVSPENAAELRILDFNALQSTRGFFRRWF